MNRAPSAPLPENNAIASIGSSFASALEAARLAAGQQSWPTGALYMVATPIGNLADITLRALHALQLADVVACEDTRHTAHLLRAYGIAAPTTRLLALHQHNEHEAAQAVIARLQQGLRAAYVSDAGTPAISDPGARLAATVQAAGLRVLPLPGASSITTALCAAGLPSAGHGNGVTGLEAGWVFAGFLPAKAGERQRAVQALQVETRAVVLLEAPHRIQALADALATLGERPLTLARELTKQFENITTLPARQAPQWLAAAPERSRGEFVLVLHPLPQAAADAGATLTAGQQRILALLLEELPVKSAARLTAAITGASRNALYAAALAMRKGED